MPIPFYWLYGLAPEGPSSRTAHVETVQARAALHQGRVEPHRHADLNQVTLWTAGKGAYRSGADTLHFSAPTLVWMPAGHVHGFEVDAATDATVLSFSNDLALAAAEAPGLETILDAPFVAGLDAAEAAALMAQIGAVADEGERPDALAETALVARLRLMLIALQRLRRSGSEGGAAGKAVELLSRFRRLLDRHFADGWGVEDYARALAVTPYRLNAATQAALGLPALKAIHRKQIAEAKHRLLYSDDAAAVVGYAAGFADPAYFTRFFKRETGLSPARWRAQHRASGPGASA